MADQDQLNLNPADLQDARIAHDQLKEQQVGIFPPRNPSPKIILLLFQKM